MNILYFLPSVDLSQATIKSKPIHLLKMIGVALEVKFSGTAHGNFKLQSSNYDIDSYDVDDFNFVPEEYWSDMPGMETAIIEPGVILWNVTYTHWKWLRLVWTRTSGTGTIDNLSITYREKNE